LALRDSSLYFATWDAVYRYPLTSSRLRPLGGPDTVVIGLPLLEHGARSIAVDARNNLFVNIGAPSNACERDYPRRDFRGAIPCSELTMSGGIWRFSADGRKQRQSIENRFASGLRHTVALAVNPADDELYGAPHGIDHLRSWWPDAKYSAEEAATIPSETLFRVEAGGDYGFPYCMYDPRTRRMIVTPAYREIADTLQGRCARSPRPIAALPAHSAPMALAWAGSAGLPAEYRDVLFVATHGSLFHAPRDPQGYAVMMVRPTDSSVSVFADGRSSFGTARPSGLAFGRDGSLYVSDDFNRRVWLIRWVGQSKRG
jgi:glucose/arabinose dehydrogenase